jgi:hypothetical protein
MFAYWLLKRKAECDLISPMPDLNANQGPSVADWILTHGHGRAFLPATAHEPGGGPMIDVHCPDCGRVLIGTRQILSLTAGDAGVELAYVCGCGRPGAELIRRSPRARGRRPQALASTFGKEPRPIGVEG